MRKETRRLDMLYMLKLSHHDVLKVPPCRRHSTSRCDCRPKPAPEAQSELEPANANSPVMELPATPTRWPPHHDCCNQEVRACSRSLKVRSKFSEWVRAIWAIPSIGQR